MSIVEPFSCLETADETGMKFVVIFSVVLLLACLVLAQREPECLDKPRVEGSCPQDFSGYTFSSTRARCERFNAKGCEINGNYFPDRDECESKCIQSWQGRLQDLYIRSTNQFSEMVDNAMDYVTSLAELAV